MTKMNAGVMVRAIGNDFPMPSALKYKAGELVMACRLIPNFEFDGETDELIALIEDRKSRLLDLESRTVNEAIDHLRKFARASGLTESPPSKGGIGGSMGWRNS